MLVLSLFSTSFVTAVRPLRAASTDVADRARTSRAATATSTATERARTSRARTSPRRDQRHARSLQLAVGLLAVGTGVGLLIRAELGVASWDVLHVALSDRTGLTVGTVSMAVAVAATGFAALLGERPRPGTLVPVVVIAPTIDLVLDVVSTPTTLGGQTAMLTAGMLVLAAGVGAYIASDHGAGPGDLVFLGIARHGVPRGAARVLVDGTAVLVGWSLGGPVGIGTVLLTVGLGPAIASSIRLFDLAPARAEVGRRDRAFHHAVGLELHRELEGV
jgi:uncharacterized membrane protein YczE